MRRLGVIPAAGQATRWAGMYKELLPIGNGRALIDHTVEAMAEGRANAALVVTSAEKLPVLQGHLNGRHDLPIYYTIQRGDNDIYSALEESFPIVADWYLFAMPDTLYPAGVFDRDFHRTFALGTFETSRPERFGVLQNGRVHNKQALPGERFTAWGTLVWGRDVVAHWLHWPPKSYTDAINMAMGTFEYATLDMGFYHDFASYDDYARWMRA